MALQLVNRLSLQAESSNGEESLRQRRAIGSRAGDLCQGHRGGGFVPHPWLGNAHVQTLLPTLEVRPRIPWQRLRLELPDGDFIDIATSGANRRGASRIAILVHGIGGLQWAHYLTSLAATLLERGWTVVAPELRGAGREPNRLARSYHHGDTEDFRFVCRYLHRQYPEAEIVAVGWSLGGGVVLKALGEDKSEAVARAAVSVSAPYRIRECADHMSRGVAALYQRRLLAQVKDSARRKHARVPLPGGIDLAAALSAQDFLAFGHAYTAPVNGFAGIDDYCDRACCEPYLAAIARPTLIVHALDDPITPASTLPPAQAMSSHVVVELSERGGHVGFVETGRFGLPALWLNRRVPAFLEAALAGITDPLDPL